MDRLEQIRRKLETLASFDIEECADLDLGIRKHRFRLEPPLPDAEVGAFEERYGISLPPEYRDFITSVGSSGAGPYYGLLPLAQGTEHLNCDTEAICKRKLGAASPLSDKVYQPDWKIGQDDWLVEVGGANWRERQFGPESWDPFQGSMAICDQGCTYYTVLVLNGPERGPQTPLGHSQKLTSLQTWSLSIISFNTNAWCLPNPGQGRGGVLALNMPGLTKTWVT
jgi:hypothetical protein